MLVIPGIFKGVKSKINIKNKHNYDNLQTYKTNLLLPNSHAYIALKILYITTANHKIMYLTTKIYIQNLCIFYSFIEELL
ncbi:hypothetical protein N473_24855 [Pseudoalteromonas luteoviolacea CPMOR-1]|uniref:Uncharacterized protein n=1 Tax=Pseudoalteromonas luteoviolacea CPMOR-1 TaxID=1365248 RepID=A0A167IXS3_9GAMM|nr:hypothetical protein N473_24855 [Pseudoalteromonas luteoviolacea CPMOR-1]